MLSSTEVRLFACAFLFYLSGLLTLPSARLLVFVDAIVAGLQTNSTRTFKLGLSRNPILRLDQWASQCPSHDPLLLGVLPGGLTGRLRGVREQGGEGMRGSRRLERLVHLEIGGMGQRSREECADCKVRLVSFRVLSLVARFL